MAIRTELSLRVQNTPGGLARVCLALAQGHVNMLAMSLESSGTLRVVLDNPLHGAGILREQHYTVTAKDVLYTQVPNDPGALARVSKMVADAGVNVDYAYGTTLESEPMTAIVIGVEDAQRASAAAGI